MDMTMRTCRSCKAELPLDKGFYRRSKGESWTLDCRKCVNRKGHQGRKQPTPKDYYVYSGRLKVCKVCNEEKADSNFTLRNDKCGLRPLCRTCLSQRVGTSGAGRKAFLKYLLKTKYAMTVDDYLEMLERQENRCAICGGVNKTGRRLYIDHCHDTGKVRGLLCLNCNAGLGQFSDSLALLESATDYLRKNG